MIRSMLQSVTIKVLDSESLQQLEALHVSENASYIQYFTPFEVTAATMQPFLDEAAKDLYCGLFVEGEVAGFLMLRGWDAGYTIPAFGVYIGSKFAGHGLARLALAYSLSESAARGASAVMLKVHPDNIIARRTYEKAGFEQTGVDERNDNLVLQKTISHS